MTATYLLDTNVVSTPVAKRPDTAILSKLDEFGENCVIAAPVWHELHFGVQRLPAGRRKDALMSYVTDVVGTFDVLPYDDVAAAWHARERARLERTGRNLAFVDGQIAAIAHTNDLVLVTSNVRDFAPFDGLDVVDWSTA